jgi:glycosyltransferase involved in cell wall biosynthesis
VLTEQTDTTFFTPGPASLDKRRPVITSGGLEKRDYRTLAAATYDLDVDVKISAFSPNAAKTARAFPKVIPDNMSHGFYDWPELVQLYRDADIVVISLLNNNYSAGLTTLFEAMACRRPVVITKIQGLINDLAASGIVTGVNPEDPTGLRQAIVNLLNNPKEAEAQAQRGYELTLRQYNSEQYIKTLATKLMSI